MCGIVGRYDSAGCFAPSLPRVHLMLAQLRHRGPDAFGVYLDNRVALGSARLSIVDLAGGTQPVHNEEETVWIVFNGEIFNHVELREELVARGHRFYSHSDTEVIVHLFEERGDRCVEALNGQFAFAIWDVRKQELLLARDRLGVRPLFYSQVGGSLVFGSEIKSLLVDERISRELDPGTLDEIFTCWAPLPGHTAFRAVNEVPAAHTATVHGTDILLRSYWRLDYSTDRVSGVASDQDYIAGSRALLIDATRLRLRADVPVGVYLSGGIDSSALAAIVRMLNPSHLHSFSITFEDPRFDESPYQELMAQELGVEHHTIRCSDVDISRIFPEVVEHCEVPILRTSPAPMFLLSQMVHENGFKVVLTGEGADELFAGYDIFKEDRIRRFWARNPESRLRPGLLRKLYPDINGLRESNHAYLEAFFGRGLSGTDQPGYSHLVRWRNTASLKRFFSSNLHNVLSGHDVEQEIERILDERLLSWHPLSRAQYIETTFFLSQYLLSSQGDRMAMANSVEARFPFLDHRLVEFCTHVPPNLKLRGLNEKYLLKRAVEEFVPIAIRQRAKQPYRAPIRRAFFGEGAPDYVAEVLSPDAIARAGYFNPSAVAKLTEKARTMATLSELDSMAVVGILSTQLLHHQFVDSFPSFANHELPVLDLVVDRRNITIGNPSQIHI